MAQETISRWFPAADAQVDELRDRVHAALKSADPVGYPRAYRLFATSDDRFAGRIADLQMPALFSTGELDSNSTPEMSETMARLAPAGEAVTIPGQRHMMTLAAPELVNLALERFQLSPAVRRIG